jgi:hypothetical protein
MQNQAVREEESWSKYFTGFFPKAFTQSITLQGRLVHFNGDPVYSQRVQAILPSPLVERSLGTVETDVNGEFTIRFKPWLHYSEDQKVVLRVWNRTLQTRGLLGNLQSERVVDETTVTYKEMYPLSQLGDVKVELYEYQEGLPVLKQPRIAAYRPQQWTPQYIVRLLRAGLDDIVKSAIIDKLKITDRATIIKIHGGAHNPELGNDGYDTINMLQNGFPIPFLATGEANRYRAEINWDPYETDGGTPQMFNGYLEVVKKENRLHPFEVGVQEHGTDIMNVYRPGDEGYEEAIRRMNGPFLIHGQGVSHLAKGHFVVEELSVALNRSAKKNDFLLNLLAFARGVQEINKVGSKSIFKAKKSVLVQSTGLTSKGLSDFINDTLASTCYLTFRPREPMGEDDHFGIAGQQYWKDSVESVDALFAREGMLENVQENWHEVYTLSENLVNNSLPHKPLRGKAYSDWVPGSEVDDPSVPGRVVVDGHLRAMRPITTNKERPNPGDIENLKQYARFLIYTASFYHSTVHSSQGKWMTNLRFATFAENEGGTAENYGNTKPEHINQVMRLSNLLMDYDEDGMTQNPNGDVFPEHIAVLVRNDAFYKSHGYDMSKVLQAVTI